MKKSILLLVFIVSSILNASGVPAYPYPIKYKQPDGTEITIQLKGDERVHWAESTDGYTLLSNGKNGWEYAVSDVNGDLKTSGVLASEVNKRTVSELILLKRTSKNIRFSKKQVNTLKSVWEAKYGSEKLVGTSDFFRPNAGNATTNDGRRKVFTPKGTKKLIMILIEYTDVKFTKTRQNFVDLMNTQDYNLNGAEGSVRDYFREQSYWVLDNAKGFDVETVVAPNIYTADNNMAYYGAPNGSAHDIRANDLMKEAIQKADPDVDYTKFDNDGDGSIDGIYIIYAGYGEATGGGVNTIWPHASGVTGLTFDGKTASKYSCSNELNYDGSLTSIGVICHEFGHVCGAPDYYDTDYATGGEFQGTGRWDLMDRGLYNGSKSGSKPAHFNPFEKIRAGWLTSTPLTTTTSITNMPDITTFPVVYKYNTAIDNEYYLMENRQQTGFNSYCPGHGLMIYHYSKAIWDVSRNKTAPQGFYPVCASTTTNPTTSSDANSYGDISSGGCPFPGTYEKTAFYDAGTPSAKSWSSVNTGMPITNITEIGGVINFKITTVSSCNSAPSTQSSALVISPTANSLDLSWTRGNGDKVIILAKESTVDFDPINGTSYLANTVFMLGDDVGNRNYTVYNGTGNSVTVTGLNPGSTYYFAVYEYNSVDNCYLAPALIGSATTTNVRWTGTESNDWFTASNWELGLIPTSTTSIIISSSSIYKPQINSAGAVCKNIEIESGASLTMNASTAYTLAVSGNWINNGTFNAGIGTVSFNGTNDLQTISGSSTSTFNNLNVTKGALSSVLEATSLIGLSGTINPLVITSGTFKLSSASTIKPFTTSVTLGANVGFWNNGGVINGGNFSWTLNTGLLRVSAGTLNIGTSNGNSITYMNGGSIIVDGGELNVAGRISPNSNTSYGSYTQTGGKVTVSTISSESSTRAPFELNAGVPFIMSGGSIVVQKASSNETADVILLSTTNNVTGGTIQIGNSVTIGSPIIRINSSVPLYNLRVSSPSSGITTASLLSNLTVQNNIEVQSNGKLLITAGKQLTAATFTNNAGASGFVLQSDAAGTATFVNSGTVNTEIKGTVQQYLATTRNWYVSSPVSNATVPSGYTSYLYREPGDNTGYSGLATEYWKTVATGEALTVGLGYIALPTTAGSTLSFTTGSSGHLNDGEIIIPLSRTTGASKPGNNLVGNPYPSYLNWMTAIKTSNVSTTVWYRTKNNATTSVYVFDTYNETPNIGTNNNGSGVVTGMIPPMQAFWVKVNSGTTGTLTFNNTMRAHQDGTNKFRAPAANNNQQVLRLKLSNGVNIDETILLFNQNAINGIDNYDSPKMLNDKTSAISEIYTREGNEKLVINGMKNIPYNVEIPLYFKINASTATSFTLTANELSNFEEGTSVYIKNNLTGELQLISDGSSYVFEPDAAINDPAFSLIIKAPGSITDIKNPDNDGVFIYGNANKQIVINGNKLSDKSTISVYNSVGQKIANMTITKDKNVIDVPVSGVYLVTINNEDLDITRKIIIK